MRHRQLLEEEGKRSFALIFEIGDDPVADLTEFARRERLMGSSFTAIGAFRRATLGYFVPERKEYDRREIEEQVEVLAMIGNVAVSEGEPIVHAHVVLSRRDYSAMGGHLFGAEVWPTLELILTESGAQLHKRRDRNTGLALIDPDA
jgi:uncharacterized protein